MDRILVQPSEIPTDTMFLATNKNAMIALGYLAQAVMGASATVVDGFACTPTTPASLAVLLSTGSVYSLQSVDSVAYGTQGTDTTDNILKQGILLGNTTLNCAAPATSGQSINYLIQVAFSETDTNAQNIQFYNAAAPSVPLTQNINTLRKSSAILSAKAGAAATTGTQTTPAPDAGYTGLYVVTVANGQTTITSGNITQLATAPFISPKLPAVPSYIQSGAAEYAADSSGAANTITVTLNPAPAALTVGMSLRVKVANTTTGQTVMNVNGLGNVAVYNSKGLQVGKGELIANGMYDFTYDGNHIVLQSPASSGTAIAGSCKNLKIVTTSNTASTITADAVILQDVNGNTSLIQNVNQAYSTGTSGANGLDTGALAANNWYNEFIIFNPTTGTVATLLSLSLNAPTLPAGYTMFARVGAILTDGGSHLYWKIQFGRDAQYVVGTNPTTTRVMATGVGGNPNPTTPTYVQISTNLFVPPTAGKIRLGLEVSGGALVHSIVSPNSNYGGITTANVFLAQTNQAVAGSGGGVVADMLLESLYVYYASDASASSLQCLGWTDNL